jgi:hypothetical protein
MVNFMNNQDAYRNGRVPRIGDTVIASDYNGVVKLGVVYDVFHDNDGLRVRVAPISDSDISPFARNCVHLSDALGDNVPDTSNYTPNKESVPNTQNSVQLFANQ